ncbi:sensor histidine kinase [Microbacterium sp. R86528]|uniref:sensor histidine kinase n=1 Tax=Microbacterium sp. R86528 TaxID=3093864 RepID=UPI0037C8DF07
MPSHPQAVTPRRKPATPAELRSDVWLAAALLVGAVISAALGATAGLFGDESPSIGWAILYGAGLAVPLAFRRRAPEIAAIVVTLAFFIGVTARIPEFYVSNISLFIVVYSVGAWVDNRRRAFWVRVGIIVGMFLWLMVTTFQAATTDDDGGLSREGLFSPFVAYMLIQFLTNIAFFGGAYYMGDRAYASALDLKALEQRTRELEDERELTAAQAVALDRVGIARELHDVVAHHVSSMGVQAGAARTVLDADPAKARTALLAVESSARAALDELRQLLETLRSPLDDTPDGSTLTVHDLETLVAHARENGMPTTLTVIGTPTQMPELVQVNIYRIAQEALTNARRHSGAGATADVRLRYDEGAVELEVANSGRTVATARAGLGTLGMRERAAASGGTIEIGPRPRGGFLVRVRIPVSVVVPV